MSPEGRRPGGPPVAAPAPGRLAGTQRVGAAVRESFGAESAGDLSGEGLHSALAALARGGCEGFRARAGRSPAFGLDLGSAVGRTARDLAALCQSGVFGAEPHFDLVMAARQLVVVPGARWVMAELYALPFANHAFDVITAIGLLSHEGSAASALDEAVRVLAPGGFLLMAESFDYPLSASPRDRWDRDGLARQLAQRGLTQELVADGLAHTVKLSARKSMHYTYCVLQFHK